MKFYVCIKQVPDVAAATRIEGGQLAQDNERLILNAYDASALEQCLVMREAVGGEIGVVLVGPASGAETIRKALAMGADSGTHILTDATTPVFDARGCAEILSRWFKTTNYDLVACGKQSQDTDAGVTGGMLAGLLNVAYASNAVGLEVDGPGFAVTRQGDAGQELLKVPAPAVISCSNDMNDPRIPKLKGIMAAKKKPLETVALADLGVDEYLASRPDGFVETLGFEALAPRQAGRVLDGEVPEMAAELANEIAQAGLL